MGKHLETLRLGSRCRIFDLLSHLATISAAETLETQAGHEQHFRKIMGYRDLWMLKAVLDRSQTAIKEQVA